MTTLRRIGYAVLGIALTHLIFGAIVRITGSGMGCGPHWPKCYGYWFPPMDRMDLVIEVMHRYLASVLLLSLLVLVIAALRRRTQAGVGGPGGVLRAAALALGLGVTAALLGAVTVKLGNSAGATVGHWTVAMALVAAVTAAVIRAGGLGGAAARLGGASPKSRRGTLVAAVMALAAVVLGGLTAKVPGGSVACLSFPLCGANPDVARGAVHVQSGHRLIAVLLVLHLAGLFFALRKRQEAGVIRRAAAIALGLGVLQILIAGAMIGMRLPPVLRSLHEATGVSIWIACFALAYLARIASRDGGGNTAPQGSRPQPPTPPEVAPTPSTAGMVVRQPADAPAGAALQQAARAMAASALVFHQVAAQVTVRAGEQGWPRAVSGRGLTALPGVADDAERATGGLPPSEHDTVRGDHEPARIAAAVSAIVPEPEVGEAHPNLQRHAEAAAAAPPMGEVAWGGDELADQIAARVTIPDEVGEEAEELSYNLLALEADDDDVEESATLADRILSLDEEFSQQVMMTMAAGDAPCAMALAIAGSATAVSPVPAPSSLRRPSMTHSVAVIVARGADF